ncbi:exodeoxyribonuclease VII large subunit [Plastorhodobacter daqingensis]|uniref:Exodeoxyribonuclease 7 large subunit n=1 Tax=Plastorhodobacter daqingensis TaxID=1387281 RepID=A0ABW2UIA3_9RHOB
MSDLFEDPAPGLNAPEFTVSEISGAVKRVVEGEFAHVRVRGEVGRVSRPRSGHVYLDLKDDRCVLSAVIWKGNADRLRTPPEEGMEVIATGRLTTFGGQSKYQMVIEDVAPAGAGALMVMLEKRRAALAAEGLFDPARKRSLPYLPSVIGVITSPSGAVIRDILHRLRDRFPSRVLIWPVAVQGDRCANEVAAAIRGFNDLPADGPIPRPDLLIVARGGGSIEDLWGFNEEIVVRAAADSRIPLISAVGHETDTTLIDHAADRRAPTPTAAAEMAVPVRMELWSWLQGQEARLDRCAANGVAQRGQRLRDLGRALPQPEALVRQAEQRLDHRSERLSAALRHATGQRRLAFQDVAAHLRPRVLAERLIRSRDRLLRVELRLSTALGARVQAGRIRFTTAALSAARMAERVGNEGRKLAGYAVRLELGLARSVRDRRDAITRSRDRLAKLAERLDQSAGAAPAAAWARLEALERLRQTLGYRETLRRGYAVVRAEGSVVTSKEAAETAAMLEIEFHDGRIPVGGRPGRRAKTDPPAGQGSLF